MKVSVVIPVKNGGRTLIKCFDSLRSQSVFDHTEIIVLDSNSTDDSVSIATKYGAKIVSINPNEFNHGLTRNVGVLHAKADLIFFTVQDAWFASDIHLEKMICHFQDMEVQAVVGIQGYPHEKNVNPALWFKQFDEPLLESRFYPNDNFEKLSASEQFELSNWDNVNAMYRKSVLLKIPFVRTNFSEDWIWANQALKAGVKILRDPSIVMWHYHHMTFGFTIRSTYIVNYYFYYFFKKLPDIKLNMVPIFRRTATLFFKRRMLKISDRCYWLLHNYLYFFAVLFSVLLFRMAHFISSEKGIDGLYKLLCGKVPQGKIK